MSSVAVMATRVVVTSDKSLLSGLVHLFKLLSRLPLSFVCPTAILVVQATKPEPHVQDYCCRSPGCYVLHHCSNHEDAGGPFKQSNNKLLVWGPRQSKTLRSWRASFGGFGLVQCSRLPHDMIAENSAHMHPRPVLASLQPGVIYRSGASWGYALIRDMQGIGDT